MYIVANHGVIFKVIEFNVEKEKYLVHRTDKTEDNRIVIEKNGDVKFVVVNSLDDAYTLRRRMKKDSRFLEKQMDFYNYDTDENNLINFTDLSNCPEFYWKNDFNVFLNNKNKKESNIYVCSEIINSTVKIETPINNPSYIKGYLFSYIQSEKIISKKMKVYIFDEKSNNFFITISSDRLRKLENFFIKSNYDVMDLIELNKNYSQLYVRKKTNKNIIYY